MTKEDLEKMSLDEKQQLVIQQVYQRLMDTKRSELIEELLELHTGASVPMNIFNMGIKNLDEELLDTEEVKP